MIRLGGDERPQRPLAALLEWSAERLGPAVGGCVLLSRRRQPVAWAWGSVGSALLETDAELARRLQRRLFPPELSSALAHRLDADPAQAPVAGLEPSDLGPDAERVGALLAERDLSLPSLLVLRGEGRVAAIAWLCSEREDGDGHVDRLRALRRVQPLLQLAVAAGDRPAPLRRPGLAAHGLTARELAVAELALTGARNAAIAARLGISERTVKNHMGRVLAKCGVRSRTQLIALHGFGGEGMGLSGEAVGTSG